MGGNRANRRGDSLSLLYPLPPAVHEVEWFYVAAIRTRAGGGGCVGARGVCVCEGARGKGKGKGGVALGQAARKVPRIGRQRRVAGRGGSRGSCARHGA